MLSYAFRSRVRVVPDQDWLPQRHYVGQLARPVLGSVGGGGGALSFDAQDGAPVLLSCNGVSLSLCGRPVGVVNLDGDGEAGRLQGGLGRVNQRRVRAAVPRSRHIPAAEVARPPPRTGAAGVRIDNRLQNFGAAVRTARTVDQSARGVSVCNRE